MNVQEVRINSVNNNYGNSAKTSFKALPSEIQNALRRRNRPKELKHGKLGRNKRKFLKEFAGFFKTLETRVKEPFTYKLGQPNEIPEKVAGINIGELTLVEFDEYLQGGLSKRFPEWTRGKECAPELSLGAFISKLLTKMNVSAPEEIKTIPRKPTIIERIGSLFY